MTPGATPRFALPPLLQLLRPKQWTKNAVVMAAFFFALGDRTQAHRLGLPSLFAILAATGLFCIVSSGVYIFNDLRDVEADRRHPVKRRRPLAAGQVSARTAQGAALALLLAGCAGAWLLARPLAAVIWTYVAVQVLYTLWLKHVALVDVFVIASGFVLRALAGAVVLAVDISPWLLVCTFLLALFLALCKRRHEKLGAEEDAAHRPSLADYEERLLDQLIAVVSSATIVAYAIYTLAPDTVAKFGTSRLGFTIPFVVFGVFRYLDLVYRHDKGDQPEAILLTDGPLLIDLALYALAVLLIIIVHV